MTIPCFHQFDQNQRCGRTYQADRSYYKGYEQNFGMHPLDMNTIWDSN
jgi:hypothetical protein